jgi:adenine phosphoribosyltransferase
VGGRLRGLGRGARVRARRGRRGGLRLGFILARKPGKLPREVSSVEYELEYGVDALEIHSDAVRDGVRVLVHDDLLATGGTAGALCDLVEQAGGVVAGCAFVIELAFLNGRERLRDHEVRSLVVVDDE